MTTVRKETLLRALTDMQRHQQGNHGWSVVHESLGRLAGRASAASLDTVLAAAWRVRPAISDAHLITLLGIALRTVAAHDAEAARVFRPELAAGDRVRVLERTLERHRDEITGIVTEHSNSFTGARRFLVPQLVIGAWAEHRRVEAVRLADLGTGIGLLPRQLNNRTVFDRFAPDLAWFPYTPPFRPVPLTARTGVDVPPLPTLEWVRGCHGPSRYYTERFAEVVWSLEQTAAEAAELELLPLDILDPAALTEFLRTHRITVATCNFVLYQYDEATRERVIAAITAGLGRPGLLLSMEPGHELRRMGACVRGYRAGSTTALHIADVSDAHFLGRVTLGPGFAELTGADPNP
ncbi:hypothetical protein V1L54_06030 [Streptomyces sp. TRM 70361]|uniref:hypothetical protein n=1 Tax=Streptomyces sp. TRM 70361 TaxID=3116553 RepID=UPI002E7B2AC9|nr:hypothetical protein [Streptomyces sp. TRM 70361]MEE1938976.1 hypothetical protein [Streptomyces sp. TRM 70361]